MTTPRIAYLVTEDWAFLRHRLPMAHAARAAGLEVHVLTRVSKSGTAIEREGFCLHPLSWQRSDLSPGDVGRSIAAVRRLLRQLEPAILHNVAVKPVLIGSLAATGMRTMSVVNSIVGLGSLFIRPTLKQRVLAGGVKLALATLLNRGHSVTILQNQDDVAFLRSLRVASERLTLIPGSGVDTKLFSVEPEPATAVVRILFVGRMLEDKGVRTAVEAFRLLRDKGLAVELLLAGEPDDGNPTSVGRHELEQWGREPGIRWLGNVEDVARLWSDCHIALLPSRREGFPKSLLEAAACGRAMVASDVPGCREIVKPETTGLLADVDNPANFASKLERLVCDGDARRRMGAAAREAVVASFSADVIARMTRELYLTVLRQQSGA